VLPNSADAESNNNSNGYLASFDSDGFTTANAGAYNNADEKNYVSWNWKSGSAFSNDASSTSIGSIDSARIFNNDAGFSICTYTGTGSAGTIKHGLNTVPKMIILKGRSEAKAWTVYHNALGAGKSMALATNAAAVTNSTYWGGTEPTSSVFSTGSSTNVSGNNITIVAYCFAEKQGYSKFGSYIGNGNIDGPFCFTGFKPAFVLTKTASAAYHWTINDNKRNTFNPVDKRLYASTNGVEATSASYDIKFLSNGFKIRSTSVSFNASGDEVIYMAFAENPLVTSTDNGSIPATAR
jgi:hypothetical protein